MSRTHTRGVVITAVGALVALVAQPPRRLGAQQDTLRRAAAVGSARRLSLEDALRAAQAQSAGRRAWSVERDAASSVTGLASISLKPVKGFARYIGAWQRYIGGISFGPSR